MKLRKILAGFLAGAVAMSSMVFTSVTASAAAFEISGYVDPEGEFTDYYEGYKNLSSPVKVSDLESISVNYTVSADCPFIGKRFEPVIISGGSAAWICNDYQELAAGTYTSTLTISSLDAETQSKTFTHIGYKIYNCTEGDAISGITINSVTITESSSLVPPTLVGEKTSLGSGSADSWDTACYAEVSSDGTKAIDSTDLANDFTVTVAFTKTRPQLVLQGSGDGHNWVQINPDIVVGGIAYFNKSTIVAAYGEDFSDCYKFCFASGGEGPIVISEAAIYINIPAPSYGITSSQTDGGSFAVTLNNDPYSTEVITEAEAGDDVYIFFNPNIGYELTAYMIMGRSTGEYYANENSDESEYVSDVESITFDMPEEPVAIVAYFGKALYDVYVLPCENGTVSVDNPTALYGDEIKITATPSSGYEVSSIVVKDTTGKTIATTDTFLMPDSHVTVEVVFTETGAEDDFTATAIDLGAPDLGWNATFDDATDTINMSEAWGVMYWNNIGDCSDYSKVVLKYSDSTFDNILLTVTYSDDTQDFQSATGANGEITIELDDAKKSGVFNINIGGSSIPGSIKIISVELIPEPMFNKTAAEFEAADAGKIVSQTATIDGKVAKRFTMLVGLDAIKKATKVEFTLSNGTETKVYTTDKYYTSLTASGEEVTAPEGYGFVTLTITDIPDGVTVTCTGIELIIPAN